MPGSQHYLIMSWLLTYPLKSHYYIFFYTENCGIFFYTQKTAEYFLHIQNCGIFFKLRTAKYFFLHTENYGIFFTHSKLWNIFKTELRNIFYTLRIAEYFQRKKKHLLPYTPDAKSDFMYSCSNSGVVFRWIV